MKRALILLSGPVIAGLFALVMYFIHGNLNWGSEAEKSLLWFEPMYWLIASSGILALFGHDLVHAVWNVRRRRQRKH